MLEGKLMLEGELMHEGEWSESLDVVNEVKELIDERLNISDENKKKPSISISSFWAEEFKSLENEFKLENFDGVGVVAVVRCWNKSKNELIDFLNKIEKFKKNIPNLKWVFVSINNDWEEDNFTESNLRGAIWEVSTSIPIVPIGVDLYSWTAWLNAPVSLMNEICIGNWINLENIRMMNLSFWVDISEDQLSECNSNISENKYILTARKTSDSENPFQDKWGSKELWDKFINIFRFPNEADLTELAYTMRNTFNVIPLSDIINLWGFNPLCNGESREFSTNNPNPFFNHIGKKKETKVVIRWMEDAEFFMRLILEAISSGKVSIIKELKKSMDNPIFYDDNDWKNTHELKKIRKVGNEMQALWLIISGLATKEVIPTWNNGEHRVIWLTKWMYIPKWMQDFYLNKKWK